MSPHRSYLVPNLVILVRVILAFVAVGLFLVPSLAVAGTAVVLTVVVIAMDGLDGYLARRLDLTSELGAVLDITADRIVEHIFWISFAVLGKVGLWVPLVVMTRSFLVDTARGMALAHGKTAFGSTTLQRSAVGRFLTGSRFMRTAYAVAKTGAFVLLGVEVAVARAPGVGAEVPLTLLAEGARVMVWVAVALCVVRGIPVLMDSRAYLEPAAAETGSGGA
ncbi:MAG: CDP-alcohol phosphatidyltransferase family protein [Gemmatimonadota bacterium]